MKAIVRPELVLIAEVKGEPVAFSMTLPDANYALKAAGGRLTTYGLPIGLVKLLLASRRIRGCASSRWASRRGSGAGASTRSCTWRRSPRRSKLGYTRRRDLLDARGQPPGEPGHRVDGRQAGTKTYRIYRRAV